MANKISVASQFAGLSGSPYLDVLSYLAKGVATYLFTEANFPGMGKFLPGWFAIATGTPANVVIQIASDKAGGAFKQLGAAGGGFYYIDGSGLNVRMVISTGATDIFILPLGG
jgi:hypothetical protein